MPYRVLPVQDLQDVVVFMSPTCLTEYFLSRTFRTLWYSQSSHPAIIRLIVTAKPSTLQHRSTLHAIKAAFRIYDNLVRIRIQRSVQRTYESGFGFGSSSFRQSVTFKMPTKNNYFSKFFCSLHFTVQRIVLYSVFSK